MQRIRTRYFFWLDRNKAHEAALAAYIDQLLDARSFAPTLRDGLRLIGDLRAGRIDVLLELFPWVALQMQQGRTVESIAPAVPQLPAPRRERKHQHHSGVEITNRGGKASAAQVGQNFLSSMSSMAAGFFE